MIGLVTDTHLGTRGDGDDVITLLEQLAEGFEARGVETVVHLGDVAFEEPPRLYRERVEQVRDVFADFDLYMAMGNHDALAVDADEFESIVGHSLNTVIERDGNTSVILLNSTGDGESAGIGRIDDAGKELLEDELAAGQNCLILTHYPLQYTPYYQQQDFFDVRPEYTFPVNKQELTPVFSESQPSVSLVCGHLHPFKTIQTDTSPLGTPLMIVEPIQLFRTTEGGVDWWLNKSVNIENLIL